MIKIEKGEKIRAMLTVRREELDEPDKYIVMASKRGYIKKTPLSLFKNLRRVGLRALVIEDDDDLIGAAVSENGNEVLLSTRLGMACRFDQTDEEIRPMGRTARGVTGMRFKLDGDDVVSMEIIHEHLADEIIGEDAEDEVAEVIENGENGDAVEEVTGEGPQILVVTTGGMGKRSFVSSYRKTRRGAKGVTSIRLREGEEVLDAVQIVSGDELILTTAQGQLVRIPADEIRTIGRAAKGVKIMNIAAGDKVTGVAKLVKVAEEEDMNNAAAAAAAAQAENTPVEGAEVSAEVAEVLADAMVDVPEVKPETETPEGE
jgi:DNA gyrase subunit A